MWHTVTWPFALCKELELYKDETVLNLLTPSTGSGTHTPSYDWFALSVSPSTTFPCQTSPLFFSKEYSLEHPHRLVSIHPVHLTRMVALFLSDQSEAPPEKLHPSLNANTSVFAIGLHYSSGVCRTRVWFRAQGYLETGPCGQSQFPWFPPVKAKFFLGLVCLWSYREKMALCPKPTEGRIPLWLRLSWGCAAQRMEGKVGEENTEAACLGPGSAPRIS